MSDKGSLRDRALTLSALLVAALVAAWTGWVWYQRWRVAEKADERSRRHPAVF